MRGTKECGADADGAPLPMAGRQSGGSVLAVIAVLGLLLALAQATVYYRSKGSTKFLGTEKNKVQAMQMAEAGVEENIADLGKRKLKPAAGMIDVVTYNHKPLEGGSYTSLLSTVALGAFSDTVDLASTGTVGTRSQTIKARLKLNKYLDTIRTPLVVVTPETTITVAITMVPTPVVTPVPAMTVAAMPLVDATPAYAACMASGAPTCTVCHVPGGVIASATVLSISKATIKPVHKSHQGDYVTTDGTCDLYKPHTITTFVMAPQNDTTRTIVNLTTYDTTVTIDTATKVQVISWK